MNAMGKFIQWNSRAQCMGDYKFAFFQHLNTVDLINLCHGDSRWCGERTAVEKHWATNHPWSKQLFLPAFACVHLKTKTKKWLEKWTISKLCQKLIYWDYPAVGFEMWSGFRWCEHTLDSSVHRVRGAVSVCWTAWLPRTILEHLISTPFSPSNNGLLYKAPGALEFWVQFLAMPQTSCLTLGMSLSLSVLQFPICKMEIMLLFFFNFLSVLSLRQGLSLAWWGREFNLGL